MRTAARLLCCTLAVILALVGLPRLASAKASRQMAHVGLGFAKVPLLVDRFGGGYNPTGSVGMEAGLIEVGRLGLGFGAQIGYLRLGSAITDDGWGSRAWSVMPATGQIYYFPWVKGPTPLLTAGVGTYILRDRFRSTEQHVRSHAATYVDFGWNAGIGFLFGSVGSPASVVLDVRYHRFGRDTQALEMLGPKDIYKTELVSAMVRYCF